MSGPKKTHNIPKSRPSTGQCTADRARVGTRARGAGLSWLSGGVPAELRCVCECLGRGSVPLSGGQCAKPLDKPYTRPSNKLERATHMGKVRVFCSVQVLFKFCSGSVLSGCNLRRGGPPTHGENTSVRMLSAPPARGMYGCRMHECTKDFQSRKRNTLFNIGILKKDCFR